jgi:triacylglycerol lipase
VYPKLRSPVVLVHGLFGCDRLQIGGRTVFVYFARIPEELAAAGNRVILARLTPTGGIGERASQLKALIDEQSPGEPVHIVAHSMGGLDSRYMISCLGMARRVLSLTTIATPHRGTVFADWGMSRFERILGPLFDAFGVSRQAFYDLTTSACKNFNEKVLDAPDVRYFSVAGRHKGGWASPEWQLSHEIVSRVEGENDGVVSIASARYGDDCQCWEGDHISLVNWILPFHPRKHLEEVRRRAYASLFSRLANEGF